MLNLGEQLQDHRLQHLTNLSLTQLSASYIFYVLLFLVLHFYVFRKRPV